jgi:hypothetical protein
MRSEKEKMALPNTLQLFILQQFVKHDDRVAH